MFCPTCGAAKPTQLFSHIILIRRLQNTLISSVILSTSREECLSIGLFSPVCMIYSFFITFFIAYKKAYPSITDMSNDFILENQY